MLSNHKYYQGLLVSLPSLVLPMTMKYSWSLVLPSKTSSSVQNKPVLANLDFSVHYTYYVSYTVLKSRRKRKKYYLVN